MHDGLGQQDRQGRRERIAEKAEAPSEGTRKRHAREQLYADLLEHVLTVVEIEGGKEMVVAVFLGHLRPSFSDSII